MNMSDAVRKKIEAQLAGSDWSLLKSNPTSNAVRCWMYSVSMVYGPRMGGQMSTQFYRDLVNCAGVFKTIADLGHSGADLLGPLLNAYDEAHDVAQIKEFMDPFMLALATYARSTQTWQSLPQLSEVDGIHFVAVDWKTANGKHVLRPMVFFGAGIPQTDQLLAGMFAQLDMHLSRFPGELPFM